MIRDYRFRLWLDGDDIVYLAPGHAQLLTKEAAKAARVLIETIYPTAKPQQLLPALPARSVELAQRADGETETGFKYKMHDNLIKILAGMATYNEPLSPGETAALCSVKPRQISSRLSMLYGNGFLTRRGKARYLVTPEGHAFLEDHSN